MLTEGGRGGDDGRDCRLGMLLVAAARFSPGSDGVFFVTRLNGVLDEIQARLVQ